MSGVLRWVGRVLFLSLAGFATLSIIGSIAAIPSGGTGGRTLLADRAPAPPEEAARPMPGEPAAPAPEAARPDAAPAPGDVADATVVAAAPPPDPAARWLEPISYALIAIAALLGAILLALWRIGDAIRDARR